jgi:hypothetical protein
VSFKPSHEVPFGRRQAAGGKSKQAAVLVAVVVVCLTAAGEAAALERVTRGQASIDSSMEPVQYILIAPEVHDPSKGCSLARIIHENDARWAEAGH